jgi:sporulation protein YlmC with PRC-barrel domain
MEVIRMTILSSTTIVGDSVRNPAGDDLGNIEDLMLNVNDGNIQYAVLSFGGFLGMGDKLFAVPWKSLTLATDDKCFVLNTSKEKLEDAPGFDKDHWPNMADPSFVSRVNDYYRI